MTGAMNLFQKALANINTDRPPVWFMRQAGRYHSHYQNLKRQHSFMDLCKKPALARDVTMGPIADFDFDAAILFSDLLFPLESLGMGLVYDPGPKLGFRLETAADLSRLNSGRDMARDLAFQGEAMQLIRKALSPDKGLLGFVGGPLTLFVYAVEGSHAESLASAEAGLSDGRFDGFNARLIEGLAENMAVQARGGADVIAVMDTSAGDFSVETYARHVVPALRALLDAYHAKNTGVPVLYYSRGTGPDHWAKLRGLPMAGIGVDWRTDLRNVLKTRETWAVQGNFDPNDMLLPTHELEPKLREWFNGIRALPESTRTGWICGLGHGILQTTPEAHVRLFLKLQREIFSHGGFQ